MPISKVIDSGVSLLDGFCNEKRIAFVDPRRQCPVCLPSDATLWKESIVAFSQLKNATDFLSVAGSDAERVVATRVELCVVIPFLASEFHCGVIPHGVLDACELQVSQYRHTQESKGHYTAWYSTTETVEGQAKKQKLDRIIMEWDAIPAAFAHALETAIDSLVRLRHVHEARAELKRRGELAEELARSKAEERERMNASTPPPPEVSHAICC